VAKQIATPPSTGEAYRPVPAWPRLPDGIDIGQVGGIGEDAHGYIIDGGDQAEFWPDRAHILKMHSGGKILAPFGSYGYAPGQFVWPHAIALGSDGTLYVGEVAAGMRIQKFMK